MRCTSVAVDAGERMQCIREFAHPGDHHYAGAGLFGVACDSCGQPVTDVGRFRHHDCPPPAGSQRRIAEIRHQLQQRRNTHAHDHVPT